MKEYRCTRNAPYTHPCDGSSDLSARNGYYIRTQTAQDALQRMVERFPEETSFGFTVDEWKNLPWFPEQLSCKLR
jgi:hypothetical protein